MFRLLVVLCLFVLAFPRAGGAADKILWLEAPFAPFLIHDGPYKGQGYGDVVSDIITSNLNNYNSERVVASISRHFHMFEEKDNVCTVGLYKTKDREKILHFSIPSFFTLPNVIVINKERYSDFGGKGVLSLTEVLKDGKFVIGISVKRSHGQVIDDLIKQYGSENNIYSFEGEALSVNLFEMLKLGRVDGLIGLPEEVMFHAERLGFRDRIMTISIEENLQGLNAWMSHVACSKTSWGKKVIEDVNRILLEKRQTPEYRASYERWLDEAQIEAYREAYKKYFLK